MRIYVGDKDVNLVPAHYYTYEISYQVDRVLGFFDMYDELYWNVNGAGDFDIDKIQVTMHLPHEAKITQFNAYTGIPGSQGNNYISEHINDGI